METICGNCNTELVRIAPSTLLVADVTEKDGGMINIRIKCLLCRYTTIMPVVCMLKESK